ncbi:N/A [soil metagenome]
MTQSIGESLIACEVLVIIPTYNERTNIAGLVPSILSIRPEIAVLIVDDASPDGTGAVGDDLVATFPGRVGVLHRPAKRGIGLAYIEGLQVGLRSSAQYFVTMDADWSHRPEDLERLVDSRDNAALLLGSRYVSGGSTEGWPWTRRMLSRIGGTYARAVLGVPFSDMTGGFKLYRRDAVVALMNKGVNSDGYVFQIETTYRLWSKGFSVLEIPIQFVDRVAGKSKLSRKIVIEAMVVVWQLRFQRRIRRP